MDLILPRESIDRLEEILESEILDNGVTHVFVVHSSGNLIVECGSLSLDDIMPLAALTAANFCATRRMAQLLGQTEFTLLFHKGTARNVHFFRMDTDLILVSIFGNEVPIGIVRMGSSKATEQIMLVFKNQKEPIRVFH